MRQRRFLFWSLMVGTLFLLPGITACDLTTAPSCRSSGARCNYQMDCCSRSCRIPADDYWRLKHCA